MDLWVEKWNPKTIDEFALDSDIKKEIRQYLAKDDCPNMILAGNAGIGKTSIAKMIAETLPDANIQFINASADNGIDVIRSQITPFVEAMSIGGLKLVILDEADQLSQQAQGALRSLIESDLQSTRFIFTCNYPNKIIDPLKSRCPLISLFASQEDVLKRVCTIVKAEGIKIEKEHIPVFKNIVAQNFPDVRKIINIIQKRCVTGTFDPYAKDEVTTVNKLVDDIINCDSVTSMLTIREYWINNEQDFGNEYNKLANMLFNTIARSHKFVNVGPLLTRIADCIYRIDYCVDKEIQFFALTMEILNGKRQ